MVFEGIQYSNYQMSPFRRVALIRLGQEIQSRQAQVSSFFINITSTFHKNMVGLVSLLAFWAEKVYVMVLLTVRVPAFDRHTHKTTSDLHKVRESLRQQM